MSSNTARESVQADVLDRPREARDAVAGLYQAHALWQDVLWAGPGGRALVISDPRGKRTRYGPENILGVLTGNTFTPIPDGTYQEQIAW